MIYLNNAATSYPKFKETIDKMHNALINGSMGCKRDSVEDDSVNKIIFDLRESISEMIHAKKPHSICFTHNDTVAINTILLGYEGLKQGDIVLTDKYVHNAVSRPLIQLQKEKGIEILYIDTVEEIKKVTKENDGKVKFAIFSHGSNVTGDLIPVQEIGDILYLQNIPLILDVAQTLGVVDIDVEKMKISALTFAGHKALNGPQGTGGFYIRKGLPVKPILFGGTGNNSMELDPQTVFPDSFEVGTPAVHDLIGLYYSIDTILNIIGFERYSSYLKEITNYAYNKIKDIPNIILYGNKEKELPVISFNIKGMTAMEVGHLLGEYDIICRTGIHCASKAIESMNVLDEYGGTVRVSFSWFTEENEINFLIKILLKIIQKRRA